ncbi:hypothetical protein BJF84_14185 [Rhodococcus sp. CUA-806]|nr:hypothetical protein BJF84_14185 [Rhodococcus sp. CUA-806]
MVYRVCDADERGTCVRAVEAARHSVAPCLAPRRDAGPRSDRRQALIDAAIEMFTEDGSADISAAAIARRADVAHGLLFYYFTDKKGLVAAALVDMLDELAAYQSPRPEEKTERERLEGFVRRHVEFLDRYRIAYLRVIREGVFATPEINRAVQQARSNAADQVTELTGLAKPGSARVRVAVSGWIAFWTDLPTSTSMILSSISTAWSCWPLMPSTPSSMRRASPGVRICERSHCAARVS